MSQETKDVDSERTEKGLFEGLFDALSNKHSQIDLNFQRVNLSLGGDRSVSFELNGLVTMSVHTRDLTDSEKEALASQHVAKLSAPSQE